MWCFDPVPIILYNMSKQCLGWPNRFIGLNWPTNVLAWVVQSLFKVDARHRNGKAIRDGMHFSMKRRSRLPQGKVARTRGHHDRCDSWRHAYRFESSSKADNGHSNQWTGNEIRSTFVVETKRAVVARQRREPLRSPCTMTLTDICFDTDWLTIQRDMPNYTSTQTAPRVSDGRPNVPYINLSNHHWWDGSFTCVWFLLVALTKPTNPCFR